MTGGRGCGRSGMRVVAARLLGVQQHLVAEHVDQVDPHLVAELRVARLRHWPGRMVIREQRKYLSLSGYGHSYLG